MRVTTAAGIIGLAAALALSGGMASAQDIVAAAPSNQYAVAAGDVAVTAVAQLNDAADAVSAQKKIDLYKQLMQLNGTARSIHTALDATKESTKLVVVERAGKTTMSDAEVARYDTIADPILKDTETTIIDEIARSQSQAFSLDEIQQLINANSSVAAAKYNAGKFMAPDASAQEVQGYMIQAVIKIIKTFKESVAS